MPSRALRLSVLASACLIFLGLFRLFVPGERRRLTESGSEEEGCKKVYVAWKNEMRCVETDSAVEKKTEKKVPENPASKSVAGPGIKSGNGGGSGGGEEANRKSAADKRSVSRDDMLRRALVKFSALNADGRCVAWRQGGMNGTLVKEEILDGSGAEIDKDGKCCSACANNKMCEFWVRSSPPRSGGSAHSAGSSSSSISGAQKGTKVSGGGGVGLACWLLKGFNGFVDRPHRRSSFSASFAKAQHSRLGLPVLPGKGAVPPGKESKVASAGRGRGGGGGGGKQLSGTFSDVIQVGPPPKKSGSNSASGVGVGVGVGVGGGGGGGPGKFKTSGGGAGLLSPALLGASNTKGVSALSALSSASQGASLIPKPLLGTPRAVAIAALDKEKRKAIRAEDFGLAAKLTKRVDQELEIAKAAEIAREDFDAAQEIVVAMKRRKEFLTLKGESVGKHNSRSRLGLGLFKNEKAHTEAHKTRSFLRSNWLGTR